MKLQARQQDGAPLRDHLLAAAQSGGGLDPLLLEICPPEGRRLYDVWRDLASARPQGLGGASAIPPSEVLAWQTLHGVRLTPWELDTLAAMDRAALASAPGAHKGQS